MTTTGLSDMSAPNEHPDARLPAVAVIGTGIMGSAMAKNLIRAGLRTAIWDRSPSSVAVDRGFGVLDLSAVWLAMGRSVAGGHPIAGPLPETVP